jgi:hypothetical protein
MRKHSVMKYLLVLVFTIICTWLVPLTSFAQTDTVSLAESVQMVNPLKVSVFVDTYYAFDINQPADKNRPFFLYSHNRHNEFALNNAILSATYTTDKVRGSLGLITGTYARANYAAEPELFRNIYEAFAGYQLAKGLWLDAGVFSSHIGAETAISLDNLTLTRSLMAENSPYYETGVKLTYEANDQLTLTALVLNGWQNIQENNDNKAIGTQIQYKPDQHVLLNSSTFIGKEKPAYADTTLSTNRFFHNFFAQIEFSPKFTLLAAFDIGFQQKTNAGGYDAWYTPNIILSYKPTVKMALAGRIEYYDDKAGIIIPTFAPNGFQTISYSLTLDYRPVEEVALRLEGRPFHSQESIFTNNTISSTPLNSNAFVIGSIAFKF